MLWFKLLGANMAIILYATAANFMFKAGEISINSFFSILTTAIVALILFSEINGRYGESDHDLIVATLVLAALFILYIFLSSVWLLLCGPGGILAIITAGFILCVSTFTALLGVRTLP